jgi:hypothetical protein
LGTFSRTVVDAADRLCLNPSHALQAWRRDFAGKVLAATGYIGTVAVVLGHSSIFVLLQRYLDVDLA